MLSFHWACEINKQRIKSTQKQQTFCKTFCKFIKTFCIHKITANSPKFQGLPKFAFRRNLDSKEV